METVFRPLFPRYLFVHMDPGRCRWLSINSTFGVQRLICAGDEPLPVPEAVIHEIRSREDKEGAVLLSPANLRRGQRVTIIEGPLTDLAGIFEEMVDRDRAVLLLDILGRSVRVRLPRTVVISGG
jgi:transcriptional antiterminator RfaH